MGRLVLLSVDGLRPDIYRAPESRHRFPNLTALEKAGASAEAVETIYPSTTYPAHATIVTGLPPRVHGIYSHLASLDPTEKARPWCWFAPVLQGADIVGRGARQPPPDRRPQLAGERRCHHRPQHTGNLESRRRRPASRF